jgi:hypothetical protein
MTIKYNVNIIGGSQFVLENERLFNVSYLFRRIAILICYDVEFPELARMAAKLGATRPSLRTCPLHRKPRLRRPRRLHRQSAAGRQRRHPLRSVGGAHAVGSILRARRHRGPEGEGEV